MKALSIKQPWLNWILAGRKTIETRTWRTKYRGELLLCASQQGDWTAWAERETATELMEPRGVAVAVARLMDCRPMTEADEAAAMCQWDDRRYAWLLEDVRPILPVPVRGALGLFECAVPVVWRGAAA